jgi:hypothetical protein
LLVGVYFAFKFIGVELDNPNSVQDDFRQSFFWLWQYYDDSLFQNDFYAEMYKSHVTRLPLLNLIFKSAVALKINLIAFSKYLSIVIGILSSVAAYLFASTLSKNKLVALFFSIFISYVFYCTDHVSAAQARSFIWIGLMLYMYFKNSGKDIASAITCFLLLFISPNTFLLCLGMEALSWLYKSIKEKQVLVKSKSLISTCVNALSAFVLYKVIFKDIQTQGVGTPFSKSELMALPEFNPGGRHPIFGSHLADGTWFRNEHWGFGYGYLDISNIVFIGLVALVIYFVLRKVLKHSEESLNIVLVFASSSLSLYFASQLLFPILYLPSRYIAVPTMIIAVVFIFLALEKIVLFFAEKVKNDYVSEDFAKQSTFWGMIAISILFSSFYIFNPKTYIHLRFVSMKPEMLQVFKATPKDSLIAGYPILYDLNTVSILAQRKVYADYERSIAYTKETLAEIRRRTVIALAMTYSSSKEEFIKLAKENGITHFLALIDYYSPKYLKSARYINPYNKFLRKLVSKKNFFLKDYLIQRNQRYVLIDISKLYASVQR